MEMSFSSASHPVTTNAPPPIHPPTLPTMALSFTQQDATAPAKTQEELDALDCKVAVNDLKGKIHDTIVKIHNGVYKSSIKEFTNALEHMDIDPVSKLFLRTRMVEAVKTNKNITKANGTIAYTSEEYLQVLFETLMECKVRTGVTYRNNTHHALRSRPDRRQSFHPYKKESTSSAETSVPHKPLHTHLPPQHASGSPLSPCLTVNTLPPLQPSTQPVNIDDSYFKQCISNLFFMSKMTHELVEKYEAEQDGMSPDQKEQFQQIVDSHWKIMRTTFE